MRLQGKVAIVTGGSRGIGRAIALGFAQEGAAVALCARDGDAAGEVAAEITARGGNALGLECDVRDERQVNEFVDRTVSAYDGVDILVANASVIDPVQPVQDMPADQWRYLLDVNVTGVMLTNRAVLPLMRRQNYGRIQNLGSGLEFAGLAGLSAYCASKGAVTAFTRVVANEVADCDIKVNVHYPGDIKTDMNPGGTGAPEDTLPCATWLASLPPDGPSGRIFVYDREFLVEWRESTDEYAATAEASSWISRTSRWISRLR